MIANTVRPLPLTDNKENAWKNRIASSVNSSNIIEGSGISVNYSPYGTTIKMAGVDENFPLMWMGDFDIEAEYFPNMIVRVRPDVNYYDIADGVIPMGSTDTTGYATVPISPGLFICVGYVPAGACDSDWFNYTMAAQYPDGIPMSIVNGTRFYDYNVYYPVYPEIPSQYTSSVVYGAYGLVANQTYWQAMPAGMKAVNMCLPDGTLGTTYVIAYTSGSAFLTEYLPHNP
jgi:hypothetical protein